LEVLIVGREAHPTVVISWKVRLSAMGPDSTPKRVDLLLI